jgi:hypothetical protein
MKDRTSLAEGSCFQCPMPSQPARNSQEAELWLRRQILQQ